MLFRSDTTVAFTQTEAPTTNRGSTDNARDTVDYYIELRRRVRRLNRQKQQQR